MAQWVARPPELHPQNPQSGMKGLKVIFNLQAAPWLACVPIPHTLPPMAILLLECWGYKCACVRHYLSYLESVLQSTASQAGKASLPTLLCFLFLKILSSQRKENSGLCVCTHV